MNTSAPTAAMLVADLRAAKAAETAAMARRLAIEADLVGLFAVPEGGEGTHKDEEFSITWKLTRKVDTEAVQAAWNALAANTQKAFRWKADIDLKNLRALQELDLGAYRKAAEFITTSPAKPAITLKSET
jgi:hypothetical protein